MKRYSQDEMYITVDNKVVYSAKKRKWNTTIKVNDLVVAEFDKPLKKGEYMFKLNYDGKNYKAEMLPLWWYRIKSFFKR